MLRIFSLEQPLLVLSAFNGCGDRGASGGQGDNRTLDLSPKLIFQNFGSRPRLFQLDSIARQIRLSYTIPNWPIPFNPGLIDTPKVERDNAKRSVDAAACLIVRQDIELGAGGVTGGINHQFAG